MGWFSKKISQPKKQQSRAGSKVVGGVLGLSAAGTMALGMLITPWEMRVHVGYLDTVGGNKIPTACAGVTGPEIVVGKHYSDAECDVLEAAHGRIADEGVSRALTYPVSIYTKASFISFAYNVGLGNFQRSTLLKKANAGDIVGACNELSRWVFVKGTFVKGLQNRRINGDKNRISEHTLCMIGIDPGYKTPLFEVLYVQFKDWRSRYETVGS